MKKKKKQYHALAGQVIGLIVACAMGIVIWSTMATLRQCVHDWMGEAFVRDSGVCTDVYERNDLKIRTGYYLTVENGTPCRIDPNIYPYSEFPPDVYLQLPGEEIQIVSIKDGGVLHYLTNNKILSLRVNGKEILDPEAGKEYLTDMYHIFVAVSLFWGFMCLGFAIAIRTCVREIMRKKRRHRN